MDDLYLPNRHGRGIHLHGPLIGVVVAGMACLAAAYLSVVVDHLDKRSNEARYLRFARVATGLALYFRRANYG